MYVDIWIWIFLTGPSRSHSTPTNQNQALLPYLSPHPLAIVHRQLCRLLCRHHLVAHCNHFLPFCCPLHCCCHLLLLSSIEILPPLSIVIAAAIHLAFPPIASLLRFCCHCCQLEGTAALLHPSLLLLPAAKAGGDPISCPPLPL
jgi:hypothetical protein